MEENQDNPPLSQSSSSGSSSVFIEFDISPLLPEIDLNEDPKVFFEGLDPLQKAVFQELSKDSRCSTKNPIGYVSNALYSFISSSPMHIDKKYYRKFLGESLDVADPVNDMFRLWLRHLKLMWMHNHRKWKPQKVAMMAMYLHRILSYVSERTGKDFMEDFDRAPNLTTRGFLNCHHMCETIANTQVVHNNDALDDDVHHAQGGLIQDGQDTEVQDTELQCEQLQEHNLEAEATEVLQEAEVQDQYLKGEEAEVQHQHLHNHNVQGVPTQDGQVHNSYVQDSEVQEGQVHSSQEHSSQVQDAHVNYQANNGNVQDCLIQGQHGNCVQDIETLEDVHDEVQVLEVVDNEVQVLNVYSRREMMERSKKKPKVAFALPENIASMASQPVAEYPSHPTKKQYESKVYSKDLPSPVVSQPAAENPSHPPQKQYESKVYSKHPLSTTSKDPAVTVSPSTHSQKLPQVVSPDKQVRTSDTEALLKIEKTRVQKFKKYISGILNDIVAVDNDSDLRDLKEKAERGLIIFKKTK